MTTLTKNRIIEKGDEYLDKSGAWKPVPKDEIGLQIMFSTLKEVRRPSEKPKPNGSAKPDAERPTTKIVDPTDSRGTPEHPVVITIDEAVKAFDPAAHGLPTVVSKKAHKLGETADPTKAPFSEAERIEKHTASLTHPKGPIEKAALATAEVVFPSGSPDTIWTGRNGTFHSVAVNLHRRKDVCAIVPQGKRGAAKNAIIEFPVSAIPQMIDFLQKQLP